MRVRVRTTHYLIIQDFGSKYLSIDGVLTPLVAMALVWFHCDYLRREDREKLDSLVVRI